MGKIENAGPRELSLNKVGPSSTHKIPQCIVRSDPGGQRQEEVLSTDECGFLPKINSPHMNDPSNQCLEYTCSNMCQIPWCPAEAQWTLREGISDISLPGLSDAKQIVSNRVAKQC